MIKHILTNDAVLIPTNKGVMQYQKGTDNYNLIIEMLKDMNNNLDTIIRSISKEFNYEDDDISITQEKNSENIEVYYNGKYYPLDKRLAKEFIYLMVQDDGFKPEYGANFIKKLLGSTVPFEELINELYKYGFCFNKNGDILIGKHYEEECCGIFYKRRLVCNSSKLKMAFVITDPSRIEKESDGIYIYEYDVVGTHMLNNNVLNCSYSSKPEAIFSIIDLLITEKNNEKYASNEGIKLLEDNLGYKFKFNSSDPVEQVKAIFRQL